MATKRTNKSQQLQGVLGNLRNGTQIVVFQKNGVVKSYDANLPVKRPNQYKRGK